MFERIRFPDGQISAKWVQGDNSHVIRQRLNSYEDLMFLAAIGEIGKNKHENYDLFIPCMFGQRSDRRFGPDQSFDLKIITDVINSCNFWKVEVFDPHSDVTLALINNSKKRSSLEFVVKAVADIRQKMCDEQLSPGLDDILLVSPDAGAYKKVFEFGEKLNLPVMGAMKHRDKDGKITLMFTHDVEGKDCLIVDDLCDGGYTFELLGKALREHKARKVYLYVSHGLFSKGFIELHKIIDHIYCTNSHHDLNTFEFGIGGSIPVTDYVTQYKVI
jgi:ribose-phosphate pyrophosphokinase